MYLKESTALQNICRNRLEKMRLRNYSNTESFFSEFEKIVNELKGAGAKMTQKEKLKYMLNTLPESYSYIGDLIDTLKEEDQTAEYIRNKIKLAEMKNQGKIIEKSTRRKRKKEHATSVESMDISHGSVKMAAKRDTVAQHGTDPLSTENFSVFLIF